MLETTVKRWNFQDRTKSNLKKLLGKGKVLVVTNILVSDRIRKAFESNVLIWDNKDLTERIETESSYAQYLINPKQALIEDVVVADSTIQQKQAERDRYIKNVKQAFKNQDLVLFLGAGVSMDSGVPLWGTLIKTLHINMLKKLTSDKELSFEQQEMIEGLQDHYH